MSKSPFYNVFIKKNNRDITNLITSFTHEDCSKEDDLLKLTLTNKNIDLIDDKDFTEGTELVFQYGYLGGKQSGKRSATINDIDYSYGKTIDITISALDNGRFMKKSESNRVWKDFTASQIVQTIATRYNMEFSIAETKTIYKSMPQANRSDFELIKYLTTIEKGNYIFYVKNNTIYFNPRDLKKTSSRTFVFNDPNGAVISFKVKQKDDKKTSGAKKTTVPGTNVDDSNADDKTKLGGKLNYYDVNANATNATAEDKSKSTGNTIPVPTSNKAEAENVANKAKKDAELKNITATLVTEGDPLRNADEIITIAGVAKKHAGNWYVEKAVHNITGSGYLTTLSMAINGSIDGSGDKNKTQGPSDSSKTQKLNVYDVNSNKVNNSNRVN